MTGGLPKQALVFSACCEDEEAEKVLIAALKQAAVMTTCMSFMCCWARYEHG